MGRLLTGAAITVVSFVVVAPLPAGATQNGPVTTPNSARHDCDNLLQAQDRHRRHHRHRHHHDYDECGPPPTVPEVPFTVLLPLTGAGITAVAFVVGRRRQRFASTFGPSAG